VSCGVPVELEANAGDPDDDLASVLWLVDGVPMDDSVTHLTFTQTHELAAVATDERGGATTARKTVACGQCEGTAVACPAYNGNPSACNAEPGCRAIFVPWIWVCTGVRVCGVLNEQDCNVADGCG